LLTNNHVVIGKIPDEDFYGTLAGSWGLYADNVLVKGSMIAKTDDYASGISTNSEAMMIDNNNTMFPNAKKGNILLWAGAESDEIDAIESANFRVDMYGNLYAGSGYFNGTIITDAII